VLCGFYITPLFLCNASTGLRTPLPPQKKKTNRFFILRSGLILFSSILKILPIKDTRFLSVTYLCWIGIFFLFNANKNKSQQKETDRDIDENELEIKKPEKQLSPFLFEWAEQVSDLRPPGCKTLL
jgi:hypothetical protein